MSLTQPQDCPRVEAIAAMLSGHLSSAERDELLAHTNSCAQCYELLVECMRDLEEEPLDGAESGALVSFPGAIGERALETGGAAQKSLAFPWQVSLRRWYPRAAAAAMPLAMALGVAWLLLPISLVHYEQQIEVAALGAPPSTGPEQQTTRRASQRLSQVVDPPQFELVMADLQKGWPMALALASTKQVVVDPKAISENAWPQAEEVAHAFVLAHEWSHLAENETRAFSPIPLGLRAALRRRIGLSFLPRAMHSQASEVRADGQALFAVIAAGYNPESIVDPEQGFFTRWIRDVPDSYGLESHPHPERRIRELGEQLQRIRDGYSRYEFGLHALYLGQNTIARDLLDAMASNDGQPAVLTAQAAGLLRSAWVNIARCNSWEAALRLPPLVRPLLSIRGTFLRGGTTCVSREATQELLDEAEQLFSSVGVDGPFGREVAQGLTAIGLMDSARMDLLANAERYPEDPWLRLALALEQEASGRYETATLQMRELAQVFPENPDIAFHLAKSLRTNAMEAEAAWQSFLALERCGFYAGLARVELGSTFEDVDCSVDNERGKQRLDWPAPEQQRLGEIETLLAEHGWALRVGRENRSLATVGMLRVLESVDGLRWLAGDEGVIIVEAVLEQPVAEETVESKLGLPLIRQATTIGHVWIYSGLAVPVIDGEAWRLIFGDTRVLYRDAGPLYLGEPGAGTEPTNEPDVSMSEARFAGVD